MFNNLKYIRITFFIKTLVSGVVGLFTDAAAELIVEPVKMAGTTLYYIITDTGEGPQNQEEIYRNTIDHLKRERAYYAEQEKYYSDLIVEETERYVQYMTRKGGKEANDEQQQQPEQPAQ